MFHACRRAPWISVRTHTLPERLGQLGVIGVVIVIYRGTFSLSSYKAVFQGSGTRPRFWIQSTVHSYIVGSVLQYTGITDAGVGFSRQVVLSWKR